MRYAFTPIPDAEIPPARDPLYQHLVSTYASETNKTAGLWRAVPDDLLDYRPHERTNTVRSILVHQISPSPRFFAHFVGTDEPPVGGLLPPGERPVVRAYLDRYVDLARGRLPQLASAAAGWWLKELPFFGGLVRQRVWMFWRRVLHTCHHRTQVQTWLRLAGYHVPAIYGPSVDVSWGGRRPDRLGGGGQLGVHRPWVAHPHYYAARDYSSVRSGPTVKWEGLESKAHSRGKPPSEHR